MMTNPDAADAERVSDQRMAELVVDLNRQDPTLAVIAEPAELARLSSDFHSYSPILEEELLGRRAQVAVRAHSVSHVITVAAACSRLAIPLTVRGAGTGNYGQCVPLAGGVLLDLSGLGRFRSLDGETGAATAEAGCLLAELDRELAPHGRALRLAPSTYRSATVGGFIAGGSGGIGSLRWGFLRDPGHLLGLEVVTVEPEPRLLQLDAQASSGLNHAYGTNGILTSVTLATTEAVAWKDVVVSFSDWSLALEASRDLSATALLLNALCLLEAPIAARMPWPDPPGPPGHPEHRLVLMAAPDTLAVLPAWLRSHGATKVRVLPPGSTRGLSLRELTWNHTTLHWRSQVSGWTYLQMLLPQPEGPFLEAIRHRWDHDVLWHLEGVRQQGSARLAALPLVRWRGRQDLFRLMEECRDLGAVIFNPHVLTVEDGSLGIIDGDQVAAKAEFDPGGLLNPGKLRGWLSRSPG